MLPSDALTSEPPRSSVFGPVCLREARMHWEPEESLPPLTSLSSWPGLVPWKPGSGGGLESLPVHPALRHFL